MTDATNDGTLKDGTVEDLVQQKADGLRADLEALFTARGIENGAELLARLDEIRTALAKPKLHRPGRHEPS